MAEPQVKIRFSAEDAGFTASVNRMVRETARKLQSGSNGGGVFGGLFGGNEIVKKSSEINRFLKETEQVGKKIANLKIPDQFRQAARHILDMQRGMEQFGRTVAGRDFSRRVRMAGQDPRQPWSVNWGALGYSQRQMHDVQRRLHEASFGASGENFLGSIGSMGRRVGSSFAGNLRAGAGTMLGFAGLAGIGSMIGTALSENRREIQGVDTLFKQLASGETFSGIRGQLAGFAKDVQMAASEASELAANFAHVSGATDAGAVGRAKTAAMLGRALGIEPGSAANLFGRAELAGYGGTEQSQRRFALLLTQTIQGSGMTTRSEQVMGDLVGQIEKVAGTTYRTMGEKEVGAYGDQLAKLYSNNPALRGGGAVAVLDALNAVGSGGGGAASETFAYGAFLASGGGKLDMTDFERYKEAPLTAPGSVWGSSDPRTKMDLIYAEADKRAAGMNARNRRNAWILGVTQLGGGQVSTAATGQMYDLRQYQAAGSNAPGYRDFLLKLGTEYHASGNLPPELKAALGGALGKSGDAQFSALKEIMPRVLAEGGGVKTDLQQLLESEAALKTAMSDLGGPLQELTTEITKKLVPAIEAITAPINTIEGWFGGGSPTVPDATKSTIEQYHPGGLRGAALSAMETVFTWVGAQDRASAAVARSGNRAWRNFNPGNIEGRHFGATGNDGRFAIYPTPQAGWNAMESQLRRYYSGATTGTPLRTVRQILSTWSPQSDPTNQKGSTANYINAVARKLGVNPDAVLDFQNRGQIEALMGAMATHEAGVSTPYGSTFGAKPAAPKMPPALDKALSPPVSQNDARLNGQFAMDVTFRDARGRVMQRRKGYAVSEPRVTGSEGHRISWSDSLSMPGWAEA